MLSSVVSEFVFSVFMEEHSTESVTRIPSIPLFRYIWGKFVQETERGVTYLCPPPPQGGSGQYGNPNKQIFMKFLWMKE